MKKLAKTNQPSFNQAITPELIGQIIKARRLESGLRIEDAAALCGVAKQTFMKIEHGNPSSQLKSILQICGGLGIKLHITPWQTNEEINDDWI